VLTDLQTRITRYKLNQHRCNPVSTILVIEILLKYSSSRPRP